MDFSGWIADPSKVGATAIMVAIIVAFYKGYVVTSSAYAKLEATYEKRILDLALSYDARLKECVDEKNEYKRMVLNLLEVTDRTLTAKGAPPVQRGKP